MSEEIYINEIQMDRLVEAIDGRDDEEDDPWDVSNMLIRAEGNEITSRSFDSYAAAEQHWLTHKIYYDREQLWRFCPLIKDRCRMDCMAFRNSGVKSYNVSNGNRTKSVVRYAGVEAGCAYIERFIKRVEG